VTPSSKVVGDLALYLAAVGADPADFEEHPEKYDVPDSVVGFMAGELGDLPGGWPEPFRSKVLVGRTVKIGVTELTSQDLAGLAADPLMRRATLNRLLFPGPTRQYEQGRELYGDLSSIETIDYLYGLQPGREHVVEVSKGVVLYLGLEAIGEVDDKGMRTVMTTMNGQLRPVFVRDRSVSVESKAAEKADGTRPGHVAAPFSGVVTLQVIEGESLAAGATIATIEAMKMEAAISTPVAGTVVRLAVPRTQQVESGDLLVVVEQA
jgi:pyruvate carboxylase